MTFKSLAHSLKKWFLGVLALILLALGYHWSYYAVQTMTRDELMAAALSTEREVQTTPPLMGNRVISRYIPEGSSLQAVIDRLKRGGFSYGQHPYNNEGFRQESCPTGNYMCFIRCEDCDMTVSAGYSECAPFYARLLTFYVPIAGGCRKMYVVIDFKNGRSVRNHGRLLQDK